MAKLTNNKTPARRSESVMRQMRAEDQGRLRCRNCGSPVSHRFCRVLGDNRDDVYGCLECTTMRDLARGGAAEE